ncbi:MAG: hypothetical protein AAFN40_24450 [Cyanobacteria bacterium J06560_6]
MAFPTLWPPRLAVLGKRLSRWIGITTIALLAFHALSTLLFAVLGLAPGHNRWPLLLTFAGVLAVAGMAVGIQRYAKKAWVSRLLGTVSGGFSGAVLGFFVGGQWGNQQARWAFLGLTVGGLLLGLLAFWAYRNGRARRRMWADFWANFLGSAIALISSLCAYTLAFGLAAWVWMALSTDRFGLVVLLSPLAVFYLWCARQGLKVCWQYWRWGDHRNTIER